MTVWLDVTTVRGWGRPALGIVRVEAETARQFLAAADPTIRFCRFDAEVRSYYEVGPEELAHALARVDIGGERPAVVGATVSVPAAPLVLAVTPAQVWKRCARALLAPLRAAARDCVLRFGAGRRQGLRALFQGLRQMRAALNLLRHGDPSPALPPASPPARQRPDLLFGPHDSYVSLGLDWDQKDLVYLAELKARLHLKILLMCYDIIPIRLPHLCVAGVAARFPGYFIEVARCADLVLCISEYSRTDLRNYLAAVGQAAPALELVRLGCDIAPVAAGGAIAPEIASLLGQPFILFVSTIERRKNHETLYRAYTRLVDAGRTDLPQLVFVGMAGWGMSDLMADMRLDPRVQPYLRIFNHVSDADLARLYAGTYFTVYPSIYEGWGLPVAESLAYGKFCLASNAASIPEVGGDLVDYIDPWDVPRWAEQLAWYFDHPEAVTRREAAIRARYHVTPWRHTGAAIASAALALGHESLVPR